MIAEALCDTQIAEHAYADVSAAVQKWPGFGAFAAAMRAFPQTEVFLAGGVLRDYFRTRKCVPKDFDFFLGGVNIDEFVEHLAEHGTLSKGPFGSPRWRPSASSARYADIVPIDRFNNGMWCCKDIVDALNQFDFTANAIALDMRRPRLFDPQNGIRDSVATTMRAVRFDYPEEPISPELPRCARHGPLAAHGLASPGACRVRWAQHIREALVGNATPGAAPPLLPGTAKAGSKPQPQLSLCGQDYSAIRLEGAATRLAPADCQAQNALSETTVLAQNR